MKRKIDSLGRLVIPAEMKKQLEIKNCELVNIECTGNKVIITNPSEVDYKAIIDKAITNIDILIEIIKEQPTDNAADDLWLLDKLDGIKNTLKGE